MQLGNIGSLGALVSRRSPIIDIISPDSTGFFNSHSAMIIKIYVIMCLLLRCRLGRAGVLLCRIKQIDQDWRLFRYEDIISNKRRWVREIADHLHISLGGESCDAIAGRNDIFFRGERRDDHIRQVWPGNHKKHLRPETISPLNESCADIFEQYGYLI